MRRVFTLVVGLGVGVATTTGITAAQEVVENPTVTSDGEYVVATDDEGGDNDVEGGGTDIVVGDVTTGNSNGEVLGDPNAIYYPDLSAVPSISGDPRTPTIVLRRTGKNTISVDVSTLLLGPGPNQITSSGA